MFYYYSYNTPFRLRAVTLRQQLCADVYLFRIGSRGLILHGESRRCCCFGFECDRIPTRSRTVFGAGGKNCKYIFITHASPDSGRVRRVDEYNIGMYIYICMYICKESIPSPHHRPSPRTDAELYNNILERIIHPGAHVIVSTARTCPILRIIITPLLTCLGYFVRYPHSPVPAVVHAYTFIIICSHVINSVRPIIVL